MEMLKFVLFLPLLVCVMCTENCGSDEDQIKLLMEEVKSLKNKMSKLEDQCVLKSDMDVSKRLLLPDNQPNHPVAFSAYLTHLDQGPAIGKLREIVYDKIETNIGNGYDKFSGTFSAPSDGVYAFTWTVFTFGSSSNAGEIETELIINGQIHGTIHADTEVTNDDDSATGFVIKMLVKDDIVFIRSTDRFVPQGVLTNGHMRWTFSGWLIE